MRTLMLGAGGHAQSLADALGAVAIDAVVIALPGDEVSGTWASVMVEDDLLAIHPSDVELVNGIGQVGAAGDRASAFERFDSMGFEFRAVVHALAYVSETARLERGAQVLARAYIGPGVGIGANSLVNTGAIVEHGCRIGGHVHIAVGATVCGDVSVEDGVFVGAGATIVPGCSIGAHAVVAAGALVLGDVPAGSRVQGVPAKRFGESAG